MPKCLRSEYITRFIALAGIAGGMLVLPTHARAQVLPYGPNVTLEQARVVAAAAEAEARRNNWNVAIAIVDAGGQLVRFERLDNTQLASHDIARQKAWTAVAFKRPSKSFEETIGGGGAGLRVLGIEPLLPIEGGLPLVVDGRIVGAIGVSGVQPVQDGQVARAGADAIK
jgi:glc operon protein GlcG